MSEFKRERDSVCAIGILCAPSGRGLAGEGAYRFGSGLNEAMLDMCEIQRIADVQTALFLRREGSRHAAGEGSKGMACD